jgi:hypothetical protein
MFIKHLDPEIDSNGNKYWYNEQGYLHREDGPAIERVDKSKEWWINGKLYRDDGPTIESYDGNKYWIINDELHRLDGPAMEFADGFKRWWVNGLQFTEKNFNEILTFDSSNGIYVKNSIIFIKYNDLELILSNYQILINSKIINDIKLYDNILNFVKPQLLNDNQVIEPLVDYLQEVLL